MKHYLLGNWKSNGDTAMLAAFATDYGAHPRPASNQVTVGLALPYHLLDKTRDLQGLAVGGQNVSRFSEGAYTGEITANMLKAQHCSFCLVGHSERRQYFHESVEDTSLKLGFLLKTGILPVLCIGESLQQREAGELEAVLSAQLEPLKALPGETELVIAYEPVWAIGTGVAATPEDAANAHALVKRLAESAGFKDIPVLYGGSVKGSNAAALAEIDAVNGFLVGGASLKGGDFRQITDAYLPVKGL